MQTSKKNVLRKAMALFLALALVVPMLMPFTVRADDGWDGLVQMVQAWFPDCEMGADCATGCTFATIPNADNARLNAKLAFISLVAFREALGPLFPVFEDFQNSGGAAAWGSFETFCWLFITRCNSGCGEVNAECTCGVCTCASIENNFICWCDIPGWQEGGVNDMRSGRPRIFLDITDPTGGSDYLIIDFIEAIDVNASLGAAIGLSRNVPTTPTSERPARWVARDGGSVINRRVIPIQWFPAHPSFDVRNRALDINFDEEALELTVNRIVTVPSGVPRDGYYLHPDGDGRDLIPIVFGVPKANELYVVWVGADGGTSASPAAPVAQYMGTGWATDMSITGYPAPTGRVAENPANRNAAYFWNPYRNDPTQDGLYFLRRTNAMAPQTTNADNPNRVVPIGTPRMFARLSMPVAPGAGTFGISEFDAGTNAFGELQANGPFLLRDLVGTLNATRDGFVATPPVTGVTRLTGNDLRDFLLDMGITVPGTGTRTAPQLAQGIMNLRTAWGCVCHTPTGANFPAYYDCIVFINILPVPVVGGGFEPGIRAGGIYQTHLTQFRTVLQVNYVEAQTQPGFNNHTIFLYRNNPLVSMAAAERVYFTHTFAAEGVVEDDLVVAQVWLSTTRDFMRDFVNGNARLIYSDLEADQRFVDSPLYGREQVTLLNLHMLLDAEVIANNYLTVIFNKPVVPVWGTVETNLINLVFTGNERWFPVDSGIYGPTTGRPRHVATAPLNPLATRNWGAGFLSLARGSFALDLPNPDAIMGAIPWVTNPVPGTVAIGNSPLTTATPAVSDNAWRTALAGPGATATTTTVEKFGYNAVQFDIELFRAANRYDNPGNVFANEFVPPVLNIQPGATDTTIRGNTSGVLDWFQGNVSEVNYDGAGGRARRNYVGYTHRPYSAEVYVITTGYICASYWADSYSDYYRQGAIWPSDAHEANMRDGNEYVALARQQFGFEVQDDPTPTVLAWGIFNQPAGSATAHGSVLHNTNMNSLAVRRAGLPANAVGPTGLGLTPRLEQQVLPNSAFTTRVTNPATTANPELWVGMGRDFTMRNGVTGPGVQRRWETSSSIQAATARNHFSAYLHPVLDMRTFTDDSTIVIWFTEIVHPADNALFPGTGGGGTIAGLEGLNINIGADATVNWFHDWRLGGDPRFMVSVVVIELVSITETALPVTAGQRHGTVNVHEYPELVEFGTSRTLGPWHAYVDAPNVVERRNPRNSNEVPLIFRVTNTGTVADNLLNAARNAINDFEFADLGSTQQVAIAPATTPATFHLVGSAAAALQYAINQVRAIPAVAALIAADGNMNNVVVTQTGFTPVNPGVADGSFIFTVTLNLAPGASQTVIGNTFDIICDVLAALDAFADLLANNQDLEDAMADLEAFAPGFDTVVDSWITAFVNDSSLLPIAVSWELAALNIASAAGPLSTLLEAVTTAATGTWGDAVALAFVDLLKFNIVPETTPPPINAWVFEELITDVIEPRLESFKQVHESAIDVTADSLRDWIWEGPDAIDLLELGNFIASRHWSVAVNMQGDIDRIQELAEALAIVIDAVITVAS